MREKIENTVYFGVHDFVCDIKIIADILQIDRYNGWSKGEPIPHRKNVVSEVGVWEIQSPLPKSNSLEKHINCLLKLLLPRVDNLNLLYDRYQATSEFSVEICTYDVANFGFHLNSQLVDKINKLGASLDVDIYNL